MSKSLVLHYLDVRRTPLERLPEGAELHRALGELAPRFYRHVPGDGDAHLSHRREALLRLLDAGTPAAELADVLRARPAADLLRLFTVFVTRRVNRARARRLGLKLLLNHPELSALVATRRVALERLVRHLLGERAWSAVRRCLTPGANGTSESLLRRLLWGHIAPERIESVREALCVLADVPVEPYDALLRRRLAARADLGDGEGLPRETLFGLRGTFHHDAPASKVRALAAPPAERPADGPLTAHYKAVWNGVAGDATEPVGVASAQAPLPGRVGIVLDLSASMASSGERAYHPAALGLALVRLLQARVEEVTVHPAGGTARPEGVADLATALIEAARARPEVVLVVTDGYDNCRAGDAGDVADGLRRLTPELLVFQVVPRFAPAEDLSRRRLAESVPLLAIDREDGTGELLARVALAGAGETLNSIEMDRITSFLFEVTP